MGSVRPALDSERCTSEILADSEVITSVEIVTDMFEEFSDS